MSMTSLLGVIYSKFASKHIPFKEYRFSLGKAPVVDFDWRDRLPNSIESRRIKPSAREGGES